jgi:pimeloyl-ACP methyl ester carboxylesterase
MWESQLASMSERGWHVIAPHARGFGFKGTSRASGGERPIGMDDYAGDVVDLLDGLHVHEAVVCGLSMGGYIALALMRLAPRYVQGLVLADTRPQADTAEGVQGRRRTAELAERGGVDAVVDQMLPKLVGESARNERPQVCDLVRSIAADNSVDAIVAAIGAMMTRPDSMPLLGSIHVPTLIVVGEEDTLTPVTVSQEMQRGIVGSEIAILPKAGHLSNLDNVDAFNRALARFLDVRV